MHCACIGPKFCAKIHILALQHVYFFSDSVLYFISCVLYSIPLQQFNLDSYIIAHLRFIPITSDILEKKSLCLMSLCLMSLLTDISRPTYERSSKLFKQIFPNRQLKLSCIYAQAFLIFLRYVQSVLTFWVQFTADLLNFTFSNCDFFIITWPIPSVILLDMTTHPFQSFLWLRALLSTGIFKADKMVICIFSSFWNIQYSNILSSVESSSLVSFFTYYYYHNYQSVMQYNMILMQLCLYQILAPNRYLFSRPT